jgi:hypothetical protein
MHAYFGCLAQNPVLMRTLFIEILGLGPAGLAARRQVNLEIADFMLKVINSDSGEHKRASPLSADMALAVVGGINELVLQAIEQDRVAELTQMAGPAIRLVRAVTREAE